MATPVCPSCRADLEADLVASTGRAECPFCGADLSNVEFTSEPELEPAAPISDATLVDDEVAEEDDDDDEVAEAPSVLGIDRPIPKESKIQVVESTDERRVVFVPAGGKTGGIGFFAIVWNGFMAIFTAAMAAGFKQQGGDPPIIILILFLGLFWSVGLGFLYFWIRLRFTRTFLLLDREQFVVQRILFGRKKITETLIGPDSRATLVESYQQNDKPVYAVAVSGTNRTEKFGTAFSQEEKDWFVDTINGFLGAAGVPGACEEILQKAGGEVVDPLAPTALGASSEISIDEASPDRLRFHLPLVPPGAMRKFVGCLGAALLLTTIVPGLAMLFIGANVGFPMFVFTFLSPIALAGAFLFAWRGQVSVDLTGEQLVCRWHWRKYGMRKRLMTPSITRVAVLRDVVEKRGAKSQRPVGGPNSMKVCLVFAGKDSIALTTVHGEETAREAGGLVRYQLEQMGFQVEDA